MIKLDYSYSSTKAEDLQKYEERIKKIVSNFKNKDCKGNDYLGWYEFVNLIEGSEIRRIVEIAQKIKQQSETFVVCGIGGSYLGSRAVIDAIKGFYKTDIEIIYLGNTFDERYVSDTLNYLKDKDFSINVISKSGGTMETAVSFRLLKDLLVEKYGEKANERIYASR